MKISSVNVKYINSLEKKRKLYKLLTLFSLFPKLVRLFPHFWLFSNDPKRTFELCWESKDLRTSIHAWFLENLLNIGKTPCYSSWSLCKFLFPKYLKKICLSDKQSVLITQKKTNQGIFGVSETFSIFLIKN